MEEEADGWVAEAFDSDSMVAEFLMVFSRSSKAQLRVSTASKEEAELAGKWGVRKKRSRYAYENYRPERPKEVVGSGILCDGNMSSPTTPLDWITASSSQEGNSDSSNPRKRKETSPAVAFAGVSEQKNVLDFDLLVKEGGGGDITSVTKGRGRGGGGGHKRGAKKKTNDEWRVELNQLLQVQEKFKKEMDKMLRILAEEKKQNTLFKQLIEKRSVKLLPNATAAANVSKSCSSPETLLPLLRHHKEEANIDGELFAASSSLCESWSACPAGYLDLYSARQLAQPSIDAHAPSFIGFSSSAPVKEAEFILPDLNLPLIEEDCLVEGISQ